MKTYLCSVVFLFAMQAFGAETKRDPKKYEISIEGVDGGAFAGIRQKVGAGLFPQRIGEVFAQVGLYLNNHSMPIVGPGIARYYSYTSESVDFAAGFPVDASFKPGAGVSLIELHKGEVATTTHYGTNEASGAAHEAIHAWIASNGYEKDGAPWEVYLDDADPQKQIIKIYYPVKKPVHHTHH